jgi:uncharacterized protein
MEPVGAFVILLRNLKEGSNPLDQQGSCLDLGLDPSEDRLTAPVRVEGVIYRASQQVEIQGTIWTSARLTCDRCLESVGAELEVPLRIFAERRESRDRRSKEEIREDDVGIVYHDGQSIDLKDEIRQLLLVELPWHFVCKEDCRGLCPRCGVNRNLETCACPTSAAPPAWDGLGKAGEDQEPIA